MRILLARANSKWRSVYMPIGLGYIADAVRKEGHEVSILDARLDDLSIQQVVGLIRAEQPDVIGFTAVHMNYDISGSRALAQAIKTSGLKTRLVLGGPLALTMGESFVKEGIFDAAVVGEGEVPFVKYLQSLENDDESQIPGLIYSRDNEIRINQDREFLDDLNTTIPAWDLIKPQRYFKTFRRSGMGVIKKSSRSVPVFTSRGCPFGCIYCHNGFGRKFRPRSVQAVLDEMALLKNEYDVREIEIVDDCFNLDLNRAKDIVRGMIDRKFNFFISFPNALRVDRMDEELIDLLKEAGAYHIRYAIETASPRLQKLIHKNLDLDYARRIIEYTAEKQIYMLGFFMLGFPTETEEEMRMTVNYAVDSKLHAALFFYVSPFPGTELARDYACTQFGDKTIESVSYTDLKANLSAVPDDILHQISKRAYRRFYLSPNRIWRTFRVVPRNFRTISSAIIALTLAFQDTKDW